MGQALLARAIGAYIESRMKVALMRCASRTVPTPMFHLNNNTATELGLSQDSAVACVRCGVHTASPRVSILRVNLHSRALPTWSRLVVTQERLPRSQIF